MVRNAGRVTRFVVMAVLQAARARSLGLSQESAYSWGLNRAIFYAAAKRGFKEGPLRAGAEGPAPARKAYALGDEEALVEESSPQLVFRIGDEPQSVEAFHKQIVGRFGTPANFRAAWSEALELIGGFDRAALESRRRFYDEVYRPRRDELSDRWTEQYSPPRKPARPSRERTRDPRAD